MYQGSKRKISNKAYDVVKKHWKGKFDRKAYRQEMKKKFKITSRDADVLRTDFKNDKLKALFKTAFSAKCKLVIYCCRDAEVVYKPMEKDFEVNVEGKAKWITKKEWKSAVLNVILPEFVRLEGDLKCKGMSSSLEVCKYFKVKNPKFFEKGVPFKKPKKKSKKSKKKGGKK